MWGMVMLLRGCAIHLNVFADIMGKHRMLNKVAMNIKKYFIDFVFCQLCSFKPKGFSLTMKRNRKWKERNQRCNKVVILFTEAILGLFFSLSPFPFIYSSKPTCHFGHFWNPNLGSFSQLWQPSYNLNFPNAAYCMGGGRSAALVLSEVGLSNP